MLGSFTSTRKVYHFKYEENTNVNTNNNQGSMTSKKTVSREAILVYKKTESQTLYGFMDIV